jgi:dTDP-4-amino-4,6-dideoxygalactose transaminase
VAERLAEQITTLPLFPGMGEDEVEWVVDAVKDVDRRNDAYRA